ncbi:MAG: PDZ domain-containing protein [Armatimonadota bacterium]|nr:PDZ domain-containing protein [bacterium]MDW8321878.1 PDZ domain-containing protein [Armatimonadota bacterium]
MRRWLFAVGGVVLWFAIGTAWASVSKVAILVQLEDPSQRAFTMEYNLQNVESRTITIAIPTWTPGWYQTMPYSEGIQEMRAENEQGEPLAVQPVNHYSWRIETGGTRTVRLSYRVLAREEGMGFFGVAMGPRHAFINGAAAFVYEVDSKKAPHEVRFRLPAGWQVATAMDFHSQSELRPFGDVRDTFVAPNYDELIDSPIQMGQFEVRDFRARGVPMRVVFASEAGDILCNMDRITADFQRIANVGIDLFGNAPFKRYLFIIHLSSRGFGGGLEHLSSTVLNAPDRRGLNLNALAAHEYFHAWNVKRIRPKVLGPFDYTQPVRTRALWWCEGVTDYYATVLLVRAGLIGDRAFWQDMEREIHALENNPARERVTLEESSWKVWEGNGMGYGGLSYYNKGKVVGFLLDVAIRGTTNNRRSLDDVMRFLMERYAYPKPGFEEDGILQAINRVVAQDMSALYRQLVASTDPLPYDEILRYIGFRLERQTTSTTYFGATSVVDSIGRVIVQAVESQSPAFLMGLRSGDIVMEVDEQPAEIRIEEVVSRKKPGEPIKIAVWRAGRMMVMEGKIGGERRYSVRLTPLETNDESVIRAREGLLRGTTRVSAGQGNVR